MLLRVFVTVLCAASASFAMDEYVVEIQQDCATKSDFLTCGKYEAARFLSRLVAAKSSNTKLVEGVVDFVTIENPEPEEMLFPAARQMTGNESGFRKFVKFVQRQLDTFLSSRAFIVSMPTQARLIEVDENNAIVPVSEGRVKKKKAALLVPVVILLKLFKVKIMLALVLAGVIFIKKALIFLLLIAPSYLQMLKICKVPQVHHIEEHDYGGTGYGYGHSSHGHHIPSYDKNWAASRAYSTYKPT